MYILYEIISNLFKFRYFILELCVATVEDFCRAKEHPQRYDGSMPSNRDALIQIAKGIRYIHSKKLVHRDIKPANILISQDGRLKLSDFSLIKRTQEGCYTETVIRGSGKWMAPELLEKIFNNLSDDSDGTEAVDFFAAGCVFFFLLKRGIHPFGTNKFAIEENIRKGNPIQLKSKYMYC